MLLPVRLYYTVSVVCLSVMLVHPTQPVEIFAIFLRNLVHWPSINVHGKFYGDRHRGTPPSGELNTRGVSNIAMLDLSNVISRKRCKTGGKLVSITNRKSHMSSFRLVSNSVIFNDPGRRNCRYFALFHRIR